ncbi:hypothetical protein FKM82_007763 [Ascaphus truei]
MGMEGDTDSSSCSSSGGGPGAAVRGELETLCGELNMDAETAEEALRDFTETWSTYSLEGDVKHWLACALYVACRKGIIPTVGRGIMEGNCVSLTRILRSAKLSLIQFFNKMKKWMDMSNLPQDFRERVERLERNFEVSTVIFKKFEPIFMDIFQSPYEDPPRLPRSRKQRRLQCSVKDLFNFCWTLFVYTKGNFSMIGDDLVNSYHLLLCCLDLVYTQALQCPNKRDLLNPSFTAEVPAPDTNPEEPPCIISTLCELHDGLTVEAKGIKEHYFKPYISKLFERKILKGSCLLDLSSFTDNNKALNKEYEEYVLTVGDFDERVFLDDDAEEEIGTPRKFAPEIPVGGTTARVQVESNLQQHFEKVIIPSNFESGSDAGLGHLPMMPASPIVHPRLKEVRTDLGGIFRRDSQPLSPLSVHDRYSSPAAGSAKRRLFGDDSPKELLAEKINRAEATRIKITPILASERLCLSPDKTILTVATATVTGATGQRVTIPVHGIANESGGITYIPVSMKASPQLQNENGVQVPLTAQALISPSPKRQPGRAHEVGPSSASKPKRTGSLALFFRKVYHLASVRLRDLCVKLDVSNDLRRKIWTLFEFSLVHCTDLMKDRHLDQLLLCAVYIMAKVTKEERLFHDIMKCYRNQPQANSHVYRSVLLKIPQGVNETSANQDVEMEDCESNGDSHPSQPNSSGGNGERLERGDLITFYNHVFVERVKSFALKYAVSAHEHLVEAPPLSPFPSIKQQAVSPRRVSQQHSIYVSPHKNNSSLTPRSALSYRFNGSPSKSLKDINHMIKQEQRSKKRAITIDSDTESPAKRLCQENDDALLKRLQDVVSERANH